MDRCARDNAEHIIAGLNAGRSAVVAPSEISLSPAVVAYLDGIVEAVVAEFRRERGDLWEDLVAYQRSVARPCDCRTQPRFSCIGHQGIGRCAPPPAPGMELSPDVPEAAVGQDGSDDDAASPFPHVWVRAQVHGQPPMIEDMDVAEDDPPPYVQLPQRDGEAPDSNMDS